VIVVPEEETPSQHNLIDELLKKPMKSQVSVLYSEDLQHQQVIENRLRILNPFID